MDGSVSVFRNGISRSGWQCSEWMAVFRSRGFGISVFRYGVLVFPYFPARGLSV